MLGGAAGGVIGGIAGGSARSAATGAAAGALLGAAAGCIYANRLEKRRQELAGKSIDQQKLEREKRNAEAEVQDARTQLASAGKNCKN